MDINTPASPPHQVAFAAPPPAGAALSVPDGRGRADGKGNAGFQPFGADGFTFTDFLDIINPLQHIPVVATLYRSLSGDTIDPGSRIAGGTLFGGPIGAGVAAVNVAVEYSTGQDVGDHVIALFEGNDAAPEVMAAEGRGPAETALDDARSHIEVLRWAEREAAYHAAQAMQQNQTVAQRRGQPPSRPADTVGDVIPAGLAALAPPSPPAAPASAPMPSATTRQAAQRGAVAENGGWFTDTMLGALTRYQESQRLADLVAGQKVVSQ